MGVPQGSVLGPVLFIVYSAPIAAITQQHSLSVQLYADDTQLYLTFDIADAPDSIFGIEACLLCIRWWMADNKLKLNDEKMIVLFLRAPSLGPQPNISGLTIGNTFVSCSASARNLGAIFNQHLSMQAHIRNVCSSAFYHLHHIGRIRDVLDIKNSHDNHPGPRHFLSGLIVTHFCTWAAIYTYQSAAAGAECGS